MNIPDRFTRVFSAEVEQHDDSYRIEIPEREVTRGVIADGETYQVAVFEPCSASTQPSGGSSEKGHRSPDPPVTEGWTRQVDTENVGDEGDGITRVDRGSVVILPDTDRGDGSPPRSRMSERTSPSPTP